jgi:hypothetical protein
MLDITFENDPNWHNMSKAGKEIFASALIRSFDLLKH